MSIIVNIEFIKRKILFQIIMLPANERYGKEGMFS